MQSPNSKLKPFLKMNIFMSGKRRKIKEKSENFDGEKKCEPDITVQCVRVFILLNPIVGM